jgi:hypothetical protein
MKDFTPSWLLWASEATFHKQWRETKSSRIKTKTQTQAEENQKLFINREFLKSQSPLQVPVCLLL